MIKAIKHITIFVKDQAEALRWYTDVFGFAKRTDQAIAPGMRWVTVAPKEEKCVEFVLLKPPPFQMGADQQVGHQDMIVLETDDCKAEVERLRGKGVNILSEAKSEDWGIQAVVEDLYGNDFVLIQSK